MPTYRVESITPKRAAELLGKVAEGVNRRLHRTHMLALAAAMTRGEWKVTHQGIAIDEDGRLLDGQHRLAAIVHIDKPVKMLVAYDVPRKTFDLIDVGAPRTAGDLLHIQGVPHANATAAAAKLVIAYDELPDVAWSGALYQEMVSRHRCLEFVAPNREAWATATASAHPLSKIIRMKPSVLAAGYFLVDRVQIDDGDGLARWVEGLVTGAHLGPSDPRLVLRNMYMGGRADRRSVRQQYQLAVYLKAWEAFVEGRDVKLLRFNRGESMPKVAVA